MYCTDVHDAPPPVTVLLIAFDSSMAGCGWSGAGRSGEAANGQQRRRRRTSHCMYTERDSVPAELSQKLLGELESCASAQPLTPSSLSSACPCTVVEGWLLCTAEPSTLCTSMEYCMYYAIVHSYSVHLYQWLSPPGLH